MPKSIVKAKEYKVKDGDTLQSIADSAGITLQQLAVFNFGTDNPDLFNMYLRTNVGSLSTEKGGTNYILSSKDDP